MTPETVIEIGQYAMRTVIFVAGPMLIAGLAVGLTVSILQSITSIQEQALSMITKMLAVLATLLILMPWLLRVLKTFTMPLLRNLETFIS